MPLPSRHLSRAVLAGVAALAVLAPGCRPMRDDSDLAITDLAAYQQEVESWRAGRVERLQREDGWLSLVGLAWLEDGESTLGSDPGKDVVFPPGAPADLGVVRLAGKRVELALAPGVEAEIGGETKTAGVLATDEGGAAPTEVELLGRFLFYPIFREGRIALRIKDAEAPTRVGFSGIDHYPVDPAFRVVATYEPHEGVTIEVPNVIGEPTQEKSPGRVVFELAGKKGSIDVIDQGSQELFLVFGDPTNGKATYGGGRFLYAAPPDEKGRVVVDFNRAYNPPCVFTPYATCPLPPPQNKLAMPVEAGEKVYGHPAHG